MSPERKMGAFELESCSTEAKRDGGIICERRGILESESDEDDCGTEVGEDGGSVAGTEVKEDDGVGEGTLGVSLARLRV